jgi:hypothetical protein
VSGLDALSPEEKQVLLKWNADQLVAEASFLAEQPEHIGIRMPRAKKDIEKYLGRIGRLLEAKP